MDILFVFISIVLFVVPASLILIFSKYIKKRFNNKTSSIILLTVYFLLFSVFFPFSVFSIFLILMLLIFSKRDKTLKYLIMIFLIVSMFIITFPLIEKEYVASHNNIIQILLTSYALVHIVSLPIIYILFLLDIVIGKFFTKLNDYATKLIGISAIGYSIFIIVYQLTSK